MMAAPAPTRASVSSSLSQDRAIGSARRSRGPSAARSPHVSAPAATPGDVAVREGREGRARASGEFVRVGGPNSRAGIGDSRDTATRVR